MIIIACAENLNPSPSQAHTLKTLTAAAFFITFATTLVTTLLISYRIHSFSRQDDDLPRSSSTRIKHIIEILVQSAALYSMVAIAGAIISIVPDNGGGSLLAARSNTYSFYLFTAVRFYYILEMCEIFQPRTGCCANDYGRSCCNCAQYRYIEFLFNKFPIPSPICLLESGHTLKEHI